MTKLSMFWVGEKSEIVAAESEEQARIYMSAGASDKSGPVDWDEVGGDGEGGETTLSATFAEYAARSAEPNQIWSAYY